MADADLDAVRREFADLTGLFEDAALIASAGQGVKTLDDGRRRFKRLSTAMHRIRRRLSHSGRAPAMKRLNCAIYTRKSSDEGLEKEFNSLDAQREACAAYILEPEACRLGCRFQISMTTAACPAARWSDRRCKRLLADIKSGKVQIVVVYKVDRLTRSLADFAKIVDVLDAHGASFVSVTQQFNTTTSMGRLTLNMLLSFAQFEREIAGERIRDKIAASKAKGMWMGGNVPLGYDVRERKLIVNDAEAETVRMIFQPLRGTRIGPAARPRTRSARCRQQAPRGGRWRPGGRQPIFTRRTLYLAAESDLPRRDRAPGQGLPRPARGDHRC